MQALRTRAFWILTIVHMSSSVSMVTLALHLAPKLTDMGMSLSGAGTIVLIYTILALPTQFVAGWLADRMPKPSAYLLLHILAGYRNNAGGRDRPDIHGAHIRHNVWHRVRRSNSAADVYSGRILRTQGVCNHHGTLADAEQYMHDIRSAVRRLHVRHHGYILHTVRILLACSMCLARF